MYPYIVFHSHCLALTIPCENIAKLQTLQADITWKECTQFPSIPDQTNAVVVNGVVYCAAGNTIYCYDPSQDKWTEPLPPPPTRSFGLGQINGKLVTVGGNNKHNMATNEVYTYEESLRTRKWKQTIPPMPTARWSPVVLSLQSALIVAGGVVKFHKSTDIVEIFKPDTSQWYRSCGLPTDVTLQLVAIGDKCYTLGSGGSELDQMFFSSIDDLLHHSVPVAANQVTHIATSTRGAKSAWKKLCETETYTPALSVLAGSLLTIGGEERFVCMQKSLHVLSLN